MELIAFYDKKFKMRINVSSLSVTLTGRTENIHCAQELSTKSTISLSLSSNIETRSMLVKIKKYV